MNILLINITLSWLVWEYSAAIPTVGGNKRFSHDKDFPFRSLVQKILQKLSRYIQNSDPSTQIQTEELHGNKYHVFHGSIRRKTDYDDAWLFALGATCKFLLDVGCNVGQSSLLVAHRRKLENCVLIDPNPEALAQATFNIIRNFPKLSVKPVCAFASDQTKQLVDFYTIGTGAAGSVYREHAKSANLAQQHFSVQTMCLDDLVFEEDKSPDLIKIDVEGAEREVLNGTKMLVGRYSPLIHIEMHSNPDLSMSRNAQAILDWCDDVGYAAW